MNPLPTGNPNIAVSYRRVSSDEQGRAFGPAAQAKRIAAFAKREGLTIAADYFDDISGTLPLDERPGLSDALEAVRAYGAGVLLVDDKSRLARDEFAAFDAIRAFQLAGARIVYADGQNAPGLADGIGHLLAAEGKRELVSKLARARRLAAAEHPGARKQGGRVPLGYRRVKHGLEVDPEGAELVRTIFKRASREGLGSHRIAAELSESTGRRWSPTTIDGILANDTYMKAQPGRIVAPKVWHAAARARAARRKVGA